ncbi:MAG TPA: hypothetical protein DEQ98_08485 [Acidobacteria bacterium]|nr:hypothetical protein [Acidobacteriota bacterium]HCE03263.1 hypothetical protein [Acidobacteriota bacterium]
MCSSGPCLPTFCHTWPSWAQHVKDGARGTGSADLSRERPAFREHDVEGDSVGSICNKRNFRGDVGDSALFESNRRRDAVADAIRERFSSDAVRLAGSDAQACDATNRTRGDALLAVVSAREP